MKKIYILAIKGVLRYSGYVLSLDCLSFQDSFKIIGNFDGFYNSLSNWISDRIVYND